MFRKTVFFIVIAMRTRNHTTETLLVHVDLVNSDHCWAGIHVDKWSPESWQILINFQYSRTPFKIYLWDVLKLRKMLNGYCVKIKQKILLWILNHCIYSKVECFYSNHFIFVLLYLFYVAWKDKNLKSKLKLQFHCTQPSVSPSFC